MIARNLLVVAFGAAGTLARYAPQRLVQYPTAQLSAAWVMLENCRPKRMKGYGVELNAHVRAALEDHIEQLLARVLVLAARLRSISSSS